MKSFVREAKYFLVLICATILVSCSSGGGGDHGFQTPDISHTPVAITSANENEVTQAGVNGSNGSIAANGGVPLSPMSITGSSTGSVNNRINAFGLARKLIKSALQNTANGVDNSAAVIGVEVSRNLSCFEGGSRNINGNVQDSTFKVFYAGDTVTITFKSCNEGYGETLNGSLTLTFNSDVVTDPYDNFDFDVSISFNNFSVTTGGTKITMHGAMDMVMAISTNSFTFSISGSSFYVVAPEESVHLTDFDISFTIDLLTSTVVQDSTATIASTLIDGQISVESHFESSMYSMYPDSGYIYITGADSQLNVSVIDNTAVSLDLIIGGVEQDGYPKTVAWSALGVEIQNAF